MRPQRVLLEAGFRWVTCNLRDSAVNSVVASKRVTTVMPNNLPTVLLLQEHQSVWSPEARVEIQAAITEVQRGLVQRGYRVLSLQVKSPQALPELLAPFDPRTCIVFNWYEGIERSARDCIEVTAQLERLGYTFTGASTTSLINAQNKLTTFGLLQAHAVPTPFCQSVSVESSSLWTRYPAIVKMANEHGSECLTTESVIYDERGLHRRVTELGTRALMVSEFIEGREFTVGLWGNGKLQVLPLIEIDYSAFPPQLPCLRTYEAKWEPDAEAYRYLRLVPRPRLSSRLRERIESVARQAYHACGLRDYGRIDLRLHDQEPQVIDVNANPDLASDSSFAMAAKCAGYDSAAMIERIIQIARDRRTVD